jgi:hypothetical protein
MSLENWTRYLSISSGFVVEDGWGRLCAEVRIGPASAYMKNKDSME